MSRATDVRLAAVVPAASVPGADVGMARLGCGRVPVQVWASTAQAFYESAFNQNIGSWNTAAVTTMFQACALLPSRATDVLFAAVVPAASGPRRRCGDGPPWMRASPGAGVGVS
jgi:surface protein